MNENRKRRRLPLDIVVINYNTTSYLLRCVKSMYDTLEDASVNILVQDNGSVDDVKRILMRFPEVILSENGMNLGYAKAINKGLTECCSPYVMVLNPDTIVQHEFFEIVLDYMESHPDVGILGPRVLDPDGSTQGSARSFPDPLTGLFGRASFLSKWLPNNPITRRNVPTNKWDGITPLEVDWVSGACMVVRRRALGEVGLMDERFFMYWED